MHLLSLRAPLDPVFVQLNIDARCWLEAIYRPRCFQKNVKGLFRTRLKFYFAYVLRLRASWVFCTSRTDILKPNGTFVLVYWLSLYHTPFCLHFKIHNFEFLLPFSGSQKGSICKITIQPCLVIWYNSCRHTAEKRKGKKVNPTNFPALILDQEWFNTFLHTSIWCLNRCTPVFYTSNHSTASKHIHHCTHVEMRFEYATIAVKCWLHQK